MITTMFFKRAPCIIIHLARNAEKGGGVLMSIILPNLNHSFVPVPVPVPFPDFRVFHTPYNVRPEYENNKLRISKDKGANFEEILFPSGVYDYEDLNDFIHQKIGRLGDGKNFGINVLFDLSTYKVFIQLDENFQIDFSGSGNFHDLLGFEKKLLKTSAFGANISNSIDNIYLRCSLLNDSIVSGKRSDVLFTFSTNTKTRALPFEVFPQADYLWSKINKKYISRVRFYMTDDENREIDLNDIDISLTVVMKNK